MKKKSSKPKAPPRLSQKILKNTSNKKNVDKRKTVFKNPNWKSTNNLKYTINPKPTSY